MPIKPFRGSKHPPPTPQIAPLIGSNFQPTVNALKIADHGMMDRRSDPERSPARCPRHVVRDLNNELCDARPVAIRFNCAATTVGKLSSVRR